MLGRLPVLVHALPMLNAEYEHQKDVILDAVQYPILADADTVPRWSAYQLLCASRTRIERERFGAGNRAASNLVWEAVKLPEGP